MDSPTLDAPTPDHIAHNGRWWRERAESYLLLHSEQLPTRDPEWAVFSIPNSELDALPDVAGLDVIELGSGAAQFSLGLARQGARCTALDFSPEQIVLAEELIARATEEDGGVRPDVTLLLGDAEETGLPDASFDVAFSDYGASMFCDPLRWVPEAARLLRPGGRLAFSSITPMLEVCWHPKDDVSSTMVKDYFGLHRVEHDAVFFNLPYGEWVRLFRRSGLTIVDMIETRPREGMESNAYRSANQIEWARRWPAEMIWVLDRAA